MNVKIHSERKEKLLDEYFADEDIIRLNGWQNCR